MTTFVSVLNRELKHRAAQQPHEPKFQIHDYIESQKQKSKCCGPLMWRLHLLITERERKRRTDKKVATTNPWRKTVMPGYNGVKRHNVREKYLFGCVWHWTLLALSIRCRHCCLCSLALIKDNVVKCAEVQ